MTKKESTTYSWNLGRKLAGVENGKSIQFAYDHTGLRTRKKVDGAATLYHYAGSLLTSMESGGTVTHFGYDANGQVITMYTGGNRYFYIRNGQGDINGLVDEAGNQVVEYKYYTWGAMRSTTGTLASTIGKLNPFRYRGYFYDDETKLYYVGSRYYDPQIRRWICADGYVSTGQGILGTNMYLYCGNDPVNHFDENGCFWDLAQNAIRIFLETTTGMKAFYVGAATASALDGPLPFADITATIVSGGVLTGTAIYSLYQAVSKDKSKDEISIVIPRKKSAKDRYIYRWGGYTPNNFTPREKKDENGLSFSFIPRKRSCITTIETINATGVFLADPDGGDHVSVRPIEKV